jgi:DNA invertase Pin-like site-specific DNA recombinase
LKKDDNVIISELSRLGRSVSDVIFIIKTFIDKGAILHVIKENLIINKNNDAFSNFQIAIFSAFAELEKNIISQRTTEALRSRKQKGIILGKPIGTLQNSMYDIHLETIKKSIGLGISIKVIHQNIDVGTYQNLYKYITKRKKQW